MGCIEAHARSRAWGRALAALVWLGAFASANVAHAENLDIDVSEDTYISEAYTGKARGGHTAIYAGLPIWADPFADPFVANNHNDELRALVYFDLSVLGSSGTFSVSSATLTFNRLGGPLVAQTSTQNFDLELFRMTQDWTEGTETGTDITGTYVSWVGRNCTDGATWNDNNCSGSDWTGGSYSWSSKVSAAVDRDNLVATYSFNVTSHVQGFVAGSNTNYGWLLQVDSSHNEGRNMKFGSKEGGAGAVLSVTYTCSTGYAVNGSGTCVDYNACATNPCGAGGTGGDDDMGCTDDSPPSTGYSCDCIAGYTVSGGTCVDDNECSTGSNPCNDGDDGSATCNNIGSGGGYSCTCSSTEYKSVGTVYNAVCLYRDECTDGIDDCDVPAEADCTDLDPGFSCACRTGYTDNNPGNPGRDCSDTAGCASDPCDVSGGAGASCTDQSATTSPYIGNSCTCNMGWVTQTNGGNVTTCVDYDACASVPCGAGGTGGGDGLGCTDDSPPSTGYACNCATGYTFTGGTCVNVDGCASDPCDLSGGSGASCTDQPATISPYIGNSCTCNPGWVTDTDGSNVTSCVDYDACAGGPCGVGGTGGGDGSGCTDDAPPSTSYGCTCTTGYEPVGGTCTDIDECTAGSNPCDNGDDTSATCTNLPNGQGYTCTCSTMEYASQGDAYTAICVLRNECTEGIDDCDDPSESDCLDQDPGYTCQCRTGFTDNNPGNPGRDCVDTNGCATDPCGVGSGAGASCTDQPGTVDPFIGNGCVCNSGWMTATDASQVTTCVDVDDCAGNPCGIGGLSGAGTDGVGCTDGGTNAYSCECAMGWLASGGTCVDVDGCAGDPCNIGTGAGSTCTDQAGTASPFIGNSCTCSSGWTPSSDANNLTQCADTDDCATNPCGLGGLSGAGTDGMGCTDEGTNAYSCACAVGWSPIGGTCQDDDGCLGDPCDIGTGAGASCIDQAGGVSPFVGNNCACSSGWTPSSDGSNVTSCVDVDDCAGNPCGVGGTPDGDDGMGCTDTGTNSHVCSCRQGFFPNAGTCEDVDECTTLSNPCDNGQDPGASCFNDAVPGAGYDCGCSAGFVVSGGDYDATCVSPNECAGDNGGNDCHADAQCIEQVPGFTCTCNTGYLDNNPGSPGRDCTNVDECGDGSHLCDPDGNNPTGCTDLPGTYQCACPAGYTLRADALECIEIDECGDGTHLCDPDGTNPSGCTNLPGSYECSCEAGYRLSVDKLTCTEIDECAEQTDQCNPEGSGLNGCENTLGSYRCNCVEGFESAADELSCTDYDECAGEGTGNDCDAHADCADLPGEYTCTCWGGYSGDGSLCTTIDECGDGSHDCALEGATCTDLEPASNGDLSFTCACNSGYLDEDSTGTNPGRVCTDIDECAVAADNCSPNALCTNAAGTFGCACNAGYRGSGVTCLDINECSEGSHTCRDDQLCTNTGGSFTCGCPAGESDPGDGSGCQPTCGDNILGAGEECDFPADSFQEGCVAPDTTDPDLTPCTILPGYRCVRVGDVTDCVATCGNGLLEPDEDCDLADANGTGDPIACRDDCTEPRCGDGRLDTDRSEACDDGNELPDDGCADCTLEEGFACNQTADGSTQCSSLCGDGMLDDGEQCDEGPDNSDTAPDACRTSCALARCGDAVIDSTETCDEGDANSDTAPDACRSDCTPARCGDQVIDTAEACDNGNANSWTAACSPTCRVPADGGALDGDDIDIVAPDSPKPDGTSLFGSCHGGPGTRSAGGGWAALCLLGLMFRRLRQRRA